MMDAFRSEYFRIETIRDCDASIPDFRIFRTQSLSQLLGIRDDPGCLQANGLLKPPGSFGQNIRAEGIIRIAGPWISIVEDQRAFQSSGQCSPHQKAAPRTTRRDHDIRHDMSLQTGN